MEEGYKVQKLLVDKIPIWFGKTQHVVLIYCRIDNRLAQEKLALTVSRQSVSKWEMGLHFQ